jgi:ATP-binding cassette subfamily F protein 3
VVHRIIEVERGMIREYPGNYHDYVALRRERQLTEARVYDKQMDRIKQEQSFIDKYRAGQRARQAKGREARLERFKRDEVNQRPIELEVMNLKLPPAARSGDQVIVAEGISKSYDDKVLFRNLDLTVTRSDRIGIIGPNGAGKTTLIKCLLGEQEPDEGTVRLGSRLNIGYYRQLHEHLDMSLSVWQYLQSVIVGLDGSAKASEQQARDLAGAFLFSGMEQDKPLGSLSGGERSRAVLAGLVAGAHNVLVLDEPSNHLDIPSAERLEQSLSSDGGFDGTLLLITHDRQLLEDVCDRLVILDGDGGSRVFPGRYSEWEERQRREREEASARKSETAARKSGGGGKDDRAQAKPQAARGAAMVATAAKVKGPHARLKVEELEKKIAAAQARMVAIDQAMADPAVYVDGAKIKALQADRAKAARELQDLEDEWLRRAE